MQGGGRKGSEIKFDGEVSGCFDFPVPDIEVSACKCRFFLSLQEIPADVLSIFGFHCRIEIGVVFFHDVIFGDYSGFHQRVHKREIQRFQNQFPVFYGCFALSFHQPVGKLFFRIERVGRGYGFFRIYGFLRNLRMNAAISEQ